MSLNLKNTIEGIIFASAHPVSVKAMSEATSTPKEEIEAVIQELLSEFDSTNRGITLQQIGGGYQFRTNVELKEIMSRMYEKKPPRLSTPMLEVLSIIAYKQPVTRPEIEKIRGVDCTSVLQGLLDKSLIEMLGRSNLPGQPVIYGTTPKFLEWFQIASLEQLPPLSEVEALNRHAFEGADNLLELLNQDDGFTAENIQEMDLTLQEAGRLKSIEEIEAVASAPLSPMPEGAEAESSEIPANP